MSRTLIPVILFVAVIALVALTAYLLVNGDNNWHNAPCSEFANEAVKSIPVRCLEYFSNGR